MLCCNVVSHCTAVVLVLFVQLSISSPGKFSMTLSKGFKKFGKLGKKNRLQSRTDDVSTADTLEGVAEEDSDDEDKEVCRRP